jgi:hypothetical protein
MSRVLDYLNMSPRMWQEISDNGCHKLVCGCPKPFWKKVAQRDYGPAGRQFGHHSGINRVA